MDELIGDDQAQLAADDGEKPEGSSAPGSPALKRSCFGNDSGDEEGSDPIGDGGGGGGGGGGAGIAAGDLPSWVLKVTEGGFGAYGGGMRLLAMLEEDHPLTRDHVWFFKQ